MRFAIPTLREIAQACGYDNSTVSRALSNKPSIPAATRKEIFKVAKSMGWQPNPLASAYMAHYRSTSAPKYQANLAYVSSFTDVEKFADLPGYHQSVFAGAKARAASMGYVLEPIWLREVDFNFRQLARLLKSRGIHGLIVHGGKLPQDAFSAFDWNSFAGATWGYWILKPHLHRAAFHWNQGTRLALEHIHALGYRRVALLISNYIDHLTDLSMAATFHYSERLHRDREVSMKSLVFSLNDPGLKKKLRTWIERHAPEVIIGSYPVREVLDEMKWKVPEDVAFVTPHWSADYPSDGGIDQLPEVIGANAVDLVSAQLIRNERGIPANPKLLLNEGRWVKGKSIPPLVRKNSE